MIAKQLDLAAQREGEISTEVTYRILHIMCCWKHTVLNQKHIVYLYLLNTNPMAISVFVTAILNLNDSVLPIVMELIKAMETPCDILDEFGDQRVLKHFMFGVDS